MSAPKLQVSVEPFESGKVVYAPMSAAAAGGLEQGRLMLRLSITNQEPTVAQMQSLSIKLTGPGNYPSKTLPLAWHWTADGQDYTAPFTIAANTNELWWFQDPTDNLIFSTTPAPIQIDLGLTCGGFADPATFTFPLAPHQAPTPAGAYLFPAAHDDLEDKEYWQTNGAAHGVGAQGSQSFAYDMDVRGYDGAQWSRLLPGTDGSANEHFRVWGKPIYAMAEGFVNQVLFDVPTNPAPLTGPDWAAQKAATWGKWLTDHGYDYDADLPHAGGGNHLYIQHGDEIVSYFHMQPYSIPEPLRAPGASVQPGQLLGHAGNSGNASAPHLHVHAIRGTEAEEGPMRPLLFALLSVVETDLVIGTSGPWVSVTNGRSFPPLDVFIAPNVIQGPARLGARSVRRDPARRHLLEADAPRPRTARACHTAVGAPTRAGDSGRAPTNAATRRAPSRLLR
jgi:murein DD-endopeptidase MepM/ murein hydrolase activator NlpD